MVLRFHSKKISWKVLETLRNIKKNDGDIEEFDGDGKDEPDIEATTKEKTAAKEPEGEFLPATETPTESGPVWNRMRQREEAAPKPLENGTKDEENEEDHAQNALDENVEDKKLPEIDGTTIVRREIAVDIDNLDNNSVFFVVLNRQSEFIKDLSKMFSPFEFLGEGIDDVLDENRDVFDIAKAMHFDCLAHSGTLSKQFLCSLKDSLVLDFDLDHS